MAKYTNDIEGLSGTGDALKTQLVELRKQYGGEPSQWGTKKIAVAVGILLGDDALLFGAKLFAVRMNWEATIPVSATDADVADLEADMEEDSYQTFANVFLGVFSPGLVDAVNNPASGLQQVLSGKRNVYNSFDEALENFGSFKKDDYDAATLRMQNPIGTDQKMTVDEVTIKCIDAVKCLVYEVAKARSNAPPYNTLFSKSTGSTSPGATKAALLKALVENPKFKALLNEGTNMYTIQKGDVIKLDFKADKAGGEDAKRFQNAYNHIIKLEEDKLEEDVATACIRLVAIEIDEPEPSENEKAAAAAAKKLEEEAAAAAAEAKKLEVEAAAAAAAAAAEAAAAAAAAAKEERIKIQKAVGIFGHDNGITNESDVLRQLNDKRDAFIDALPKGEAFLGWPDPDKYDGSTKTKPLDRRYADSWTDVCVANPDTYETNEGYVPFPGKGYQLDVQMNQFFVAEDENDDNGFNIYQKTTKSVADALAVIKAKEEEEDAEPDFTVYDPDNKTIYFGGLKEKSFNGEIKSTKTYHKDILVKALKTLPMPADDLLQSILSSADKEKIKKLNPLFGIDGTMATKFKWTHRKAGTKEDIAPLRDNFQWQITGNYME